MLQCEVTRIKSFVLHQSPMVSMQVHQPLRSCFLTRLFPTVLLRLAITTAFCVAPGLGSVVGEVTAARTTIPLPSAGVSLSYSISSAY